MLASIKYKNLFSKAKLSWLAILLCALLWLLMFQTYLPLFSISSILGAGALLFNIKKDVSKHSLKYGYTALLFTILTIFLPVKTLLFYSISFAFFFMLQLGGKGVGFNGVLVLIFACPAFQYVSNTLSFPLRLLLTKWVSQVLHFFFSDLTASGNILHYQGREFSVDEACAGLNMLAASLLIGLVFIGYYQARYSKTMQWYLVIITCLLIIGLNVISNFIRIALLVLFSVMPSNWMHDGVGLVCFIVYTLIPAAAIIKLITRKFGSVEKAAPIGSSRKSLPIIKWLLIIALPIASIKVMYGDTSQFSPASGIRIKGYDVSTVSQGIIKLSTHNSLVYLKYIRGFYSTDHSPVICWKGSGYEFYGVRKEHIGGHSLYTADLINGKEKLFTAWWYDNGTKTTVDQSEWRIDMLQGSAPYFIVNVTAASREELLKQVQTILHSKILSITD